jgi:hypothetical protein
MEGMGIVSDLVFAIMPIFFIWSLHRPVMERILVIILMALGMIAALAGVMKIIHTNAWNPRENTLRDWMPLFWWYRVEEIGLIAAACAPFLKPFIERMLSRFGVSQFRFATIGLNTIRSSPRDVTGDAKKISSSTPQTMGEPQLAQHNPGRMASVVSSDFSDHSIDGKKYQRGQGCVQV